MPEFTGERVIPGQVDARLWVEHMSRYALAAQLCAGKERVLDAGCGTGYGTHALAAAARLVIGMDVSEDAIAYARRRTGLALFHVADCRNLPYGDGELDAVVAFEVIEHFAGWPEFLDDCRRALAPQGLLLVSTPNRDAYQAARGSAGPNPYHVFEFSLEEFRRELSARFPHVEILAQNHAEAALFARHAGASSGELAKSVDLTGAEFFFAVCSPAPLDAIAPYFYSDAGGNVLRERERHIELLENELAEKKEELRQLGQGIRRLDRELMESNRWATERDREAQRQSARVGALQIELDEVQRNAQSALDAQSASFDRDLAAWHDREADLERELSERAAWARERDAEVARCTELFHQQEALVHKRTEWARNLQRHVDELTDRLRALESASWVKIGRRIGAAPRSG